MRSSAIALLCVAIAVGLGNVSYGAINSGSWNTDEGHFDPGGWSETFWGGGEGQPGNVIAAGGQHWSIGGTLSTVAEIAPNTYETVYTDAYLYLNYDGPWWGSEAEGVLGYESIPFGDITVITTKTYNDNDLVNLTFEASGSGFITGYRMSGSPYPTAVPVSVTARYTGMPTFDSGFVLAMRGDLDYAAVTVVPEPTTLLIWSVLGVLGMIAYGRRK